MNPSNLKKYCQEVRSNSTVGRQIIPPPTSPRLKVIKSSKLPQHIPVLKKNGDEDSSTVNRSLQLSDDNSLQKQATKYKYEIYRLKSELKELHIHLLDSEEKYKAKAAITLGSQFQNTFISSISPTDNGETKQRKLAEMKDELELLQQQYNTIKDLLSVDEINTLIEDIELEIEEIEELATSCFETENALESSLLRIQTLNELDQSAENQQQRGIIDELHKKLHDEVEKHRNLKKTMSSF